VAEPYDRQEETDWDAIQRASQQTLNEEAAAMRAQAEPAEVPQPGPAAVLAGECQRWLSAAMELRTVPSPPVGAPPTTVYEAMVTAGAHLDSIETLLSLAIGFKGACEVKAKSLERAADDAWDDQAAREKQRGSYGRREFEGAQERYAYWRLAVRGQRKRAQAARELADTAADTERRIRLHYYGLAGARDDLSRRLTALTKQMNMES
jgi:hypothetical protein